MDEKERIRNKPFLVYKKACHHYNIPPSKIFIEIEIFNEKKIILFFK